MEYTTEYTTYDRGTKKHYTLEKKRRKNRWIKEIFFNLRRIHANYMFADYNGRSGQTILMITIAAGFSLLSAAVIYLMLTGFIYGIPKGTFWWHVFVLAAAVIGIVVGIYLTMRVLPLWCTRACIIMNRKRLLFVGIQKKLITRISIPRSLIASFAIGIVRDRDKCIYTIFLRTKNVKQYPEFPLQRTWQYKLWDEELLKYASNFDIPIEIDGNIPKNQRENWAKTKEKLDALGKRII